MLLNIATGDAIIYQEIVCYCRIKLQELYAKFDFNLNSETVNEHNTYRASIEILIKIENNIIRNFVRNK